MPEYFITGTDTGVGKTWVTLALMEALQNKGEVVVGMKPVASGCQKTSAGLRNDDAVRILMQSSTDEVKSQATVTVSAKAGDGVIEALDKLAPQISGV